ncbi:Hypp80 [Xyrichtys novacula]|uniref:Hypp80 n=1 Tax=Xyrichtys novacula TaxID=13765 RepID=A0AAV1GSH0_XYRNO|nr:Hypp80 [Xyrichtys novacula]
MKTLWKPLWRHHSISRATKLRIYNTSVLSILLYGAETWPLNKTLAARIDGFDTRALRSIEGIKWPDRVSNITLRELTQQPSASQLAAQRRLRWYGHIRRLPPEHPTHDFLHFQPKAAGWKRPCGAPRTRWIDVVTGDLHQLGLSLAVAEPLALDRPQWRRLVKLIGSTHGAVPVAEQDT